VLLGSDDVHFGRTLMMKAVGYIETLVPIYQTTLPHTPEARNFHSKRYDNLKSHRREPSHVLNEERRRIEVCLQSPSSRTGVMNCTRR
jgi:hypothetical protein